MPTCPPAESIVGESVLVSSKGNRYRVMHTKERDATDEPVAETEPPKHGDEERQRP
jgi:hypothetical protein